MRTVTIVGAGRAGGAMAIAMSRAGWSVDRIVHRQHVPDCLAEHFERDTVVEWDQFKAVGSQILIIATGDPEIKPTAGTIARFQTLPETALHLSGSLDSRELAALADRGVAVGSMHPLVSISEPETGAAQIGGSFFCIEGDESGVKIGNEIANSLGAKPFSIPTDRKPLYHAAAVMASGHLTALLDAAIETLSKCGLSASDAKGVLLPLVKSTIANLEHQSTAEALTGTFARGDAAAFKRHIESLEGFASGDIREIYLALGSRSVELMKRAGKSSARLDELEKAISVAKENCR